jgi:phosphatidate cytidylyltransferase
MMLLLIINIASIESRPHQPIVENTVPAAVLGYAYFSLFCLPFVGVSLLSNGNLLLTWLIIVVAMTDSAAYFCGRFFGKTKMSPRISPNKTVVGALGGLGGALLVAYFAGVWLLPSLGAYNLVGVGFWVGVLSIIGDLVVSLMKRIYGAKDSGDLLPGHGGLLDRMDGMIFASPALYLFLVLSNV